MWPQVVPRRIQVPRPGTKRAIEQFRPAPRSAIAESRPLPSLAYGCRWRSRRRHPVGQEIQARSKVRPRVFPAFSRALDRYVYVIRSWPRETLRFARWRGERHPALARNHRVPGCSKVPCSKAW